MLLYLRRVGESLTIGDAITVTVVGVKGDQVCLAVKAPPDVPVECQQFCRRQRRERRSLASAATPQRA